MIGALIGLLLPAAAVWTFVAAWRPDRTGDSRLVSAAIAVCGGLGLSSLTTLWLVEAGLSIGSPFVAADALLWAALVVVGVWRLRVGRGSGDVPPTAVSVPARVSPTPADWLARAAFVVVAALALATALIDYRAAPLGAWDAWAIWNQKARFLFRGGPEWTDALTILWSNPAHPLLVPASVARLWAYAGGETPLVPAGVAMVFAASIVALVMGALDTRRTRAWIAGSVLLAPRLVMQEVTAQQADIPLAFFVVAALVAARRDRLDDWLRTGHARAPLVFAGALSGLAAWTKNEGVLFLAIMAIVVLWMTVRAARPWQVGWWAAGAAPMVLTVLWLKMVLAPVPPPYLLEAQTSSTIVGRLFGAESLAILEAMARRWAGWGGPLAIGAVPAAFAAAIVSTIRYRPGASGLVLAAVGLMIGGYYAVYIATPLDAVTLVTLTFDRLLVQVWPALVFAAFSLPDSADR